MTQENKELLIKDLCTRLPYGVKVSCIDDFNHDWYDLELVDIKDNEVYISTNEPYYSNRYTNIENIRPYLFPLSSMTEEQFNEMYNYCYNAEREASKFSNGELKITYNYELIKFDYLNRNNFDYRGLIPLGLANDATDKNIY